MAYSTPGLLTDESRWLAKIARFQRMAIHAAQETNAPLFEHYESAGNTSTTETTLYEDTLLANQLAHDGDKLTFTYGGTYSVGAAQKRIRLKFDGNLLFDTTNLNISGTAPAWSLTGVIIRASATDIRYSVTFQSVTEPGVEANASTNTGVVTGLDFTTTNNLTLTGQSDTATDDVVAMIATVDFTSRA